jgi:hypothetical protein
LGKKKSKRYVVLDLGDRISTDTLNDKDLSGLVLEIQRDNLHKPYSRYSVQRVIPIEADLAKTIGLTPITLRHRPNTGDLHLS